MGRAHLLVLSTEFVEGFVCRALGGCRFAVLPLERGQFDLEVR